VGEPPLDRAPSSNVLASVEALEKARLHHTFEAKRIRTRIERAS
jgi:hypothetical protein